MTLIFNKAAYKERRQQLRHGAPDPEIILWSRLQRSRLSGHKFRRQCGIGRYVVDFYCPRAKLVIEIDGDSHFTDQAEKYDKIREEFMESLGLKTIRFTNKDIRENLSGVLETILRIVERSVAD